MYIVLFYSAIRISPANVRCIKKEILQASAVVKKKERKKKALTRAVLDFKAFRNIILVHDLLIVGLNFFLMKLFSITLQNKGF